MGTPLDRVHARYQVALAVTMKWRRNVAALPVRDVSEGGVFVVTNDPPSLRELVRLEFNLPGRAETLAVHGMAVNTTLDGDMEGRPPGVGIQFYAMDREAQRTWGQFMEQLRRTQPPLSNQAPPLSPPVVPRALAPKPLQPPPAAPKPSQQQGPAPLPAPPPPAEELSGASLELEIASEEDLYEFYMRDVAAGGMFIVTDVALPEGARLTLFIHHPLVEDCFELEAVVCAACEGPDGAGLEVEFVDLDERRLDALRDFIDADLGDAEPADAHEEPAAAPPPMSAPGAWSDPFAQTQERGALEQLFDPWPGARQGKPWSRPPPEDEFDSLFDAIAAGGGSSVRPSMPAAANEDVPDFLLAIPSWSKQDTHLFDPSTPRSIELTPDEIIELSDEPFRPQARADVLRAPARPLSRAR